MGAAQFILGCVPDVSLSFEVLLPTCVCVGHRYRSTYTIRALSLLATWVLPAFSFGAMSHIGRWLLSISAAVKREDPKDTTACQFPTRLNVHLRSAAMWCAASCVLRCATSTSRNMFPKSGHASRVLKASSELDLSARSISTLGGKLLWSLRSC